MREGRGRLHCETFHKRARWPEATNKRRLSVALPALGATLTAVSVVSPVGYFPVPALPGQEKSEPLPLHPLPTTRRTWRSRE